MLHDIGAYPGGSSPPPPRWKISWYISAITETRHLRTRWPVFYFLVFTWFWGINWTSKNVKTFIFGLHLILGGKIRRRKAWSPFFGLHRYFQWKRKQEMAPPPFSNFWARLCDKYRFLVKSGKEQVKNQIFIIFVVLRHAEACNERRGLSPRLSAWATKLRRNVAAVASRWRHCADLTDPRYESKTQGWWKGGKGVHSTGARHVLWDPAGPLL